MTGVNPDEAQTVLSRISDGVIFERFGLAFLSAVRGEEFEPVGGTGDRAIDGLEHCFQVEINKQTRSIYQLSIESDARQKIRMTLKRLQQAKVKFQRLIYVTNQTVRNPDVLADELFSEFKRAVAIRDLRWFASHVNDSSGTVSAYNVFAETYLHSFSKPGATFEVGDLSGDPRLYVFLRQLWDEGRGDLEVEDLLADALIQFALEGTDPDAGITMTRDEILIRISELISFDAKSIYSVVDRRLQVLSARPRVVVLHSKLGGYCLPYETRRMIAVRNIEDAALETKFRESVEAKLARYSSEAGVPIDDCYSIMKSVLSRVFRQQGLQFAQFMLTQHASDVFDMSLSEIVSDVVDFHNAPQGIRTAMKTPLLLTLREIIYRGSPEEGEFLSRLARSYTMLFLLQCDPKLCLAFSSMLSGLKIYVCTSILIPALSEHFLEKRNQRYSNLLRQVAAAGAELRVNETILRELVAHLRKVQNAYRYQYAGEEGFYNDEPEILYVPEMMIRAYFHCRMQGQVADFKDFFEGFVSWGMARADQELIELLREEYGIQFVSDASLGVSVNSDDRERLVAELQQHKGDRAQAENDANVILTIYALRQEDNEAGGL